MTDHDPIHDLRMGAGAQHMALMDAIDDESHEAMGDVFGAVDRLIQTLRGNDLAEASILGFITTIVVAQLHDRLGRAEAK